MLICYITLKNMNKLTCDKKKLKNIVNIRMTVSKMINFEFWDGMIRTLEYH